MQSTPAHHSLTATIRNTLQYGGVRALYAGLTLPLAAQAVYKATVFSVNDLSQQAIVDWKTQENHKNGNYVTYQTTVFDQFFGGFLAGAVNALLFVTPVEFVRNYQISLTNQNEPSSSNHSGIKSHRLTGPLVVIQDTLKSNGVLGLWRGAASTVLRDSIGCGCYFLAMTYTQRRFSANDGSPPGHVTLLASGVLAGISYWLAALPLDTMKTWIQNGTAKNMRHALELSMKDGPYQAMVALTRGWQMAYGRGAPSAAITVTTYALVFNFLNNHS